MTGSGKKMALSLYTLFTRWLTFPLDWKKIKLGYNSM